MNGPCILGLQLSGTRERASLVSPLPTSQGFSGRAHAFVTNLQTQPSFPFHLQLSCWCFASCSFPQSINN